MILKAVARRCTHLAVWYHKDWCGLLSACEGFQNRMSPYVLRSSPVQRYPSKCYIRTTTSDRFLRNLPLSRRTAILWTTNSSLLAKVPLAAGDGFSRPDNTIRVNLNNLGLDVLIRTNFALFPVPLMSSEWKWKILSEPKGPIFKISHQASWPIFGGPERCTSVPLLRPAILGVPWELSIFAKNHQVIGNHKECTVLESTWITSN